MIVPTLTLGAQWRIPFNVEKKITVTRLHYNMNKIGHKAVHVMHLCPLCGSSVGQGGKCE